MNDVFADGGSPISWARCRHGSIHHLSMPRRARNLVLKKISLSAFLSLFPSGKDFIGSLVLSRVSGLRNFQLLLPLASGRRAVAQWEGALLCEVRGSNLAAVF